MPRRYEKEIEEILDRDDRRARRTDRVRSVTRRVTSTRRRFSFSSGTLMLIGVALIAVGWIVKPLFLPLATVGALLFVVGYISYFARSRKQPHEKRWRGEVVNFPDSLPNRVRRFFGRRR
ncbi:MAG: DUF3040 domain-containing protein [Chloroflexi bacterium]|nr:DUF3040 domain-containing protein [Chloroflexota bacterium]